MANTATNVGGSNSNEMMMLVELFNLNSSPETGDSWEEMARWIKYEEDVEGLDRHWGRPHVAFLSFHSLMQFRQFFSKSLVLFDPRAEKFSDVISRLTVGMVSEYGMDSATADKVANTMNAQRLRALPKAAGIDVFPMWSIYIFPRAAYDKKHSSVRKDSRHGGKRSVAGQVPSFGYKSDGHGSVASIGNLSEDNEPSRRVSTATQPQQQLQPPTSSAPESSGDEAEPKGGRPQWTAGRKVTTSSQQPAIMEEVSIEEAEDTEEAAPRRVSISDMVKPTPAADIARLKERLAQAHAPLAHATTGSIGRKSSKPFLRRLSTAIGFDVGGAGGEEAGKSEITDIMPSLSESTHVYTGIVTTMSNARIIMIRFNEPKRFDELTTSTFLPVRFIFIIVGPSMPDVDYHEMGRTVATLMSNKAFSQVALTATRREHLLAGVDDFLDLSIIVPPGEIDSRALLTVDDVRKALKLRKKAKAALAEAKAEKVLEGAGAGPASAVPARPPEKKEIKQMEVETQGVARRGRVDHVKDALMRTGRPFGGVIDDIKYRVPYYFRDYKDALNFQCVTAALFMFCANFASAVAFGEVMGNKTEGYMGVTEILLAHGVCGVIWGLIACQPLCIQAAVGPFLVFEASLFTFCKSQNIDFLAVRFWTGVWTMLFTLVTTLVEGSFVVRYLTRFTEDIFTGLIAFIFIWEAFKFLYRSFINHPVGDLRSYCFDGFENSTITDNITHAGTSMIPHPLHLYSNSSNIPVPGDRNEPNTALLSLLLVLLTFVLTYSLKQLKTSAYFGRTLRKTLSDFGVPISVVIVIALYMLVFSDTYVPHLKAPMTFSLTDPTKRTWLVHPMGPSDNRVPMWAIWASAVPALLVGILVFAEVEIIEVLLAKPDRGLQRPHGFHWDLIVCSGLLFGCTVFGLPWMCPAAVQSLSHASSLTVMKRSAPGAAPKIDHVVEQRVTCIVVGVLHGAAAFAGIALRLIPVPVLFGLFLYLGVMGLLGLQFVDRLILAFMPQKYFPDAPFCRRVSVWRMHLFTLIQSICFGLLLAVNLITITALAFPFVLTLIALFRMFIMPKIFDSYELDAIDGRGEGQPKPAVLEDEEESEIKEGVDKKAIL